MDCEYHAIQPLSHAPRQRVFLLRVALAIALIVASGLLFTSERSLRSQREFFKQRASGALSADQRQVIRMTKHAWDAYRDHAGWHDYLNVDTMTGGTVYGNHDMAWTLVDSLDTLFVLGLHDEFDEASAWAKANLRERILQHGSVKFFEVTIRSLGGLLSAYYLSGEKHLLDLAAVLGDSLLAAFQCPGGVPCQQVDFISNATDESPMIATASSFQLEFNYLSHATKNPVYAHHATTVNKIMQQLVNEHFPDGLIPVSIDWETRRGNPSSISWGGEGDSYYEYIFKQWLQSGKQNDELKRQYLLAVDGMKARMLGKSAPSGFVFLSEIDANGQLGSRMEHLTCFVPGLLALGYKHGMPKDHLDLAKELARTCVQMYVASATKLAPESVRFRVGGTRSDEELTVDWSSDSNLLRPETVESLMVLYRVTGDSVYREYGRAIMDAFEATSKVPRGGYASTCSVFYGPARRCQAQMESFFLAETLKYLYLLFSDSDVLPLDAVVFNTEAHPFPVLR